jgi:hypothetical protein
VGFPCFLLQTVATATLTYLCGHSNIDVRSPHRCDSGCLVGVFHKSPSTVDVAKGLLSNDAVPLACGSTPPTFRVVTPPAQGSVLITARGAFTYTSTSAVPITDAFTYEVSREPLTWLILFAEVRTCSAADDPQAAAGCAIALRQQHSHSYHLLMSCTGAQQAATVECVLTTHVIPGHFMLQVTHCNGGESTATAALKYEPPGKAVANTFTYSKSPLTLDALKGVLTNDVNNPTCAAQGKLLKMTAWSTGSAGNVAVSAANCSCGWCAMTCHWLEQRAMFPSWSPCQCLPSDH